MIFNSTQYIVFLPVVLIIYFMIPQRKKKSENTNVNLYRNIFLLIASYFFYMCWIPQYAILISFSTITTFLFAKLVEGNSGKKKKLYLILSLVINFGILFTFKYYNFFMDSLSVILAKANINLTAGKFSLLLPVGISFYTFQAVAYVIDVYRNDIKHEKNFINYALFVSFFPQLVAGPIERAKNLLPQFRETHKFNYSYAVSGMKMILYGMFKKVVIADTVAIYVDNVFNNVKNYNGLSLIVATMLFSIQIYCDFSGYSDIAIGSAKMLGFRLMENFKAPYLSKSIGEFWNRWHISLNTWFKDYIYIPLGGSKKGFIKKNINLLIVFLLSGLWHGASWTFVIWGAINGTFRVIQELIKKACKPMEFNYKFLYKIKDLLKIIITYLAVCFSWIFFRANSMGDALYIVKNMLKNISLSTLKSNSIEIIQKSFIETNSILIVYYGVIAISIIILLWVDIKKNKSMDRNYDELIFANKYIAIRYIKYIVMIILIVFLFAMQNGIYGSTGQFIYFQF